jgi:hypothetical protein
MRSIGASPTEVEHERDAAAAPVFARTLGVLDVDEDDGLGLPRIDGGNTDLSRPAESASRLANLDAPHNDRGVRRRGRAGSHAVAHAIDQRDEPT